MCQHPHCRGISFTCVCELRVLKHTQTHTAHIQHRMCITLVFSTRITYSTYTTVRYGIIVCGNKGPADAVPRMPAIDQSAWTLVSRTNILSVTFLVVSRGRRSDSHNMNNWYYLCTYRVYFNKKIKYTYILILTHITHNLYGIVRHYMICFQSRIPIIHRICCERHQEMFASSNNL